MFQIGQSQTLDPAQNLWHWFKIASTKTSGQSEETKANLLLSIEKYKTSTEY